MKPKAKEVIKPKRNDPTKFLHPVLAASRLMNLVLESILWQRHGTRVRWEIKVTYLRSKDSLKKTTAPCVAMGFRASSGDVDAGMAKAEASLTGHEEILKAFEAEPAAEVTA